MVFLHGWGGDLNNFLGAAKVLSEDYRCLILDFFDEEPSTPLTLDDYVNYTREEIDKLKSDKVILIGHSFGGRVAIRLAVTGVYYRMVLIDSAGLKPKRGVRYHYRRMKYKIYKSLGLDTKNCGSSDYSKLSPVMKRTFNNIIHTYQDEEVKDIRIPTLIIWGKKDRDTPYFMAKKLRRSICDSEIILYKDCGHYSYLERYHAFIETLKAFAK